MRLRLDLAYEGTDFSGWAVQPNLRTVQAELEQALVTVLRLQAPAPTTCAGRTDAGVHARHQVVHVDVPREAARSAASSPLPNADGDALAALLRRLNGVLPSDVRVLAVREVSEEFDARFSALSREYAYRIADDATTSDPLVRRHVVSWRRPLDHERMNAAAEPLLGEHDFAAYCKRRDGATTIRELQVLRWARGPSGVLTATVRADAFCHHLVRSLVGALVVVGEGSRPIAWPGEILVVRERSSWVTVAPAHGLTLERVRYPPDEDLGRQAAATRRVRSIE